MPVPILSPAKALGREEPSLSQGLLRDRSGRLGSQQPGPGSWFGEWINPVQAVGRRRGPKVRLHPTSEEGPPTSHMGRDGAPRAGPATRTWGTRGDVARAGDMPSMRVLLAGGGNGAQRSFLPGLHPGGPPGRRGEVTGALGTLDETQRRSAPSWHLYQLVIRPPRPQAPTAVTRPGRCRDARSLAKPRGSPGDRRRAQPQGYGHRVHARLQETGLGRGSGQGPSRLALSLVPRTEPEARPPLEKCA